MKDILKVRLSSNHIHTINEHYKFKQFIILLQFLHFHAHFPLHERHKMTFSMNIVC